MDEPKIIKLENIINEEAGLVVAQNDSTIPFEIKRVYWFYKVPEGQERGHHAHKRNQKILVCNRGTVEVTLENPSGEKFDFVLDKPFEGLFVPALYWGTFRFKGDASMICLASELYSEEDYIRSYAEFKGLV